MICMLWHVSWTLDCKIFNMFRNYFKISLRNLLKYKTYFGINILGLSMAITCSILVVAFITDELSFDQFHHNKDRLFRLNKISLNPNTGISILTAENSGLMGPTIANDYPEVESITRICPWWDDVVISYEDSNINIKNFLFADSTFFELFDFKLEKGDPATALVAPSSIIITESLSKKTFLGRRSDREDCYWTSVSGIPYYWSHSGCSA